MQALSEDEKEYIRTYHSFMNDVSFGWISRGTLAYLYYGQWELTQNNVENHRET